MRNEPSASLRRVWAMKEAAQNETRQLVTPASYFRHIRKAVPDLGLPIADGGAPPAFSGRRGAVPKRWRRARTTKAGHKG